MLTSTMPAFRIERAISSEIAEAVLVQGQRQGLWTYRGGAVPQPPDGAYVIQYADGTLTSVTTKQIVLWAVTQFLGLDTQLGRESG